MNQSALGIVLLIVASMESKLVHAMEIDVASVAACIPLFVVLGKHFFHVIEYALLHFFIVKVALSLRF